MCRNIKPITAAAAAALRRPTHRSNSGRDVIRYNTQQRWKERKKLLLLLNDAFAIVQMFILLFLTATAAAAFSVDRKSDCRLLISSQRQRHARTHARTYSRTFNFRTATIFRLPIVVVVAAAAAFISSSSSRLTFALLSLFVFVFRLFPMC